MPADTRDDVTLCVALMSRKAVQGMCFHKEVIQELVWTVGQEKDEVWG